MEKQNEGILDVTFSNLTYIKDVNTVVICYLSENSVTYTLFKVIQRRDNRDK